MNEGTTGPPQWAVGNGLWERAVELRRDLHHHPELRFAEHRTAQAVAARPTECGFEVEESVAGTGVIAQMRGRQTGPHVAIRADIDALTIDDLKTMSYRSLDERAIAVGMNALVAPTDDLLTRPLETLEEPTLAGPP